MWPLLETLLLDVAPIGDTSIILMTLYRVVKQDFQNFYITGQKFVGKKHKT